MSLRRSPLTVRASRCARSLNFLNNDWGTFVRITICGSVGLLMGGTVGHRWPLVNYLFFIVAEAAGCVACRDSAGLSVKDSSALLATATERLAALLVVPVLLPP